MAATRAGLLRTQGRVLWALLLRELLTRYGRHNIGVLWLFVEPMLFTLGVTALWTATRATHGSSLPIVAFALTGYSTVLLWRNASNRTCNALSPNLSLLHHRTVRVLDIFLARILLEIAGATLSFMGLGLCFISFEWMAPPSDPLMVALAWLLTAWLAAALALVVGAASERSTLVERLWHPVAYLLFPLSGAVFMVSWLPPLAREVVLLLPMVHAVELLREAWFGPQVQAHYSLTYLVLSPLVLSLLGLAMVRNLARRVQPE